MKMGKVKAIEKTSCLSTGDLDIPDKFLLLTMVGQRNFQLGPVAITNTEDHWKLSIKSLMLSIS
uniref:Uncharacterized protein n=1 Tax=Romanomermis culicivorax TaxID=13658 RepID=A0A915IYY0_ROMCU